MDGMGTRRMRPGSALHSTPGAAVAFAAAWGMALALLAYLWVMSPHGSPGAMFLTWSVPAVILFLVTWEWLRRVGIRQVPTGAGVVVAVLLLWTGLAALAWSGQGPEWALDGLILRKPLLRWGGRALAWLPGIFGLAVAVAGLAAALEGRYRITHGEAGRRSTPPP